MSSPPHIPDPVLETVDNATRFPQFVFDKLGQKKQFFDVIVLKGTYDLTPAGLVHSAVQVNPALADEYWDDDDVEVSSLRIAADVLLYKPGTDVYVTGGAKTFEGKPHTEWGGMLVVRREHKTLIQKALRFTGPRYWKYGLLSGWTLGNPEPANMVPLRYELAYGGYWINEKASKPELAKEVYAANPSGSGHFGKSHDAGKLYPGPQIEHHPGAITASNRDYLPGGFGPIARFWQPRLTLAGTYDDAWHRQFQASPIPYYPDDLDLRFFQAAPADQITGQHLRGDEWIEMAGLFADVQAMSVQLPKLRIAAELILRNGARQQDAMALDTVHVDLDARQVYLTWRLTLPQSRNVIHASLYETHLEKVVP